MTNEVAEEKRFMVQSPSFINKPRSVQVKEVAVGILETLRGQNYNNPEG